jgi:hypothetical protein
MKAKNVQIMIWFAMFWLFAHQARAEEWIYYASTSTRDVYYDNSKIEKIEKNIIRVWAKAIFNENGKKEAFSYLKRIDRAPDNPDTLSHVLGFHEFDCIKVKVKDFSMVIYDKQNNVLYSSPKDETGKWKDIRPNSVGEILKNIVCEEPAEPGEAVVVEPVVAEKNLSHVNGTQKEAKAIHQEAIRNLITTWLDSWQSGDMETYRRCYAPDFRSKGMNLDAWVSYKTKVYRKSKNIHIRIDQLRISVEENTATAVFTQYYRSPIFKDTGKKKLEFRKINGEWKIYRESA